ILSFIFSIHHCSLVILYFALLYHILLCAKKKNTKSDTTPIKKNDNVNGAKTFPVAGKNAALGEDDPDPTSRVPQVPPNDAEVDDKSLQSDDGVSTNLLNLPLATPAGLASATPFCGDKKIDNDKQNSVASTILLSISKQLIARPSDLKPGDGQGGMFHEEQTLDKLAQSAMQAEPGQIAEHADNVEKTGQVRKPEEGGEQIERNDQFGKKEQAQKLKKLEEKEKNRKLEQAEQAEVITEKKTAVIEQHVVPLDRTQSQKNEHSNSAPESSALQSSKIQFLSTQSASSQPALTQKSNKESSKASTQSTPDSDRSLNIFNIDANWSNFNMSEQKMLPQRKSQPSKRNKKSSKKQDNRRSIKGSEKLSTRSSKDSRRSGKFSRENNKSRAVQKEPRSGTILDQADAKQWSRAGSTPIEEASSQSSLAPQESEEMEQRSMAKEHEKMLPSTPQSRLASTERIRVSMREQSQTSAIMQSGNEMQPARPVKSKDSVDSTDGVASETHSDAPVGGFGSRRRRYAAASTSIAEFTL
uniref:Uncharacterized protein n=1 Tax=Parascaris univalens TaxID=6257 RepID=A0A915AIM1_PARUN